MNEDSRIHLHALLEAKAEASITPQEAKRVMAKLKASKPGSSDAKAVLGRLQGILAGCDDLRRDPWKGKPNPLAGHCYVASEVLFHLMGGQASSWVPQAISHEGGPHWYLKHKTTGEIIDPTASQFQTPVPYEKGKGKGFLTKEPSKRAQVVLRHFFEK